MRVTSQDTANTRDRRLPSVDVARGVAVFAMFGYHLTWDLAYFRYVGADVPFLPSFRLYSHLVASTFLFLAGASLVLARRDPFDWRKWARHIATVVVAACAVTLASFVAFPDGLIGFGILHCIALSLIVATPLLFVPPFVALGFAALIAAAPFLLQIPSFDVPALIWTGLGTVQPSSNDFRPFFPWAAATLSGLALAKAAVSRGWVDRIRHEGPIAQPWRLLAWSGRHSLAIYLVHQPVFFAGLLAISSVFPARDLPDAERAYRVSCEHTCHASGSSAQACRATCACVARDEHARTLLNRAGGNALDDTDTVILSRIVQSCLRQRTE